MKESLDEKTLVDEVLRGQGQGFDVLVGRYQRALLGKATAKLRSFDDAQDIVQEVFITAYLKLPSLRAPERFGSWLNGILRNRIKKEFEKRSRRQRFLEKYIPERKEATPETLVMRNEGAERIRGRWEVLDGDRRDVFIRHYLRRQRVAEIAREVGKPVGTVKRMLSESRRIIKPEVIEMAREEIQGYQLTEEQRERLSKISSFPHTEPKIHIEETEQDGWAVRMVSSYGCFAPLEPGGEACFADYDYPQRKLKSVSHSVVEGPLDCRGTEALRVNTADFSEDGKLEWFWHPYLKVDRDEVRYCGKQFGSSEKELTLIVPGDENWNEPLPRPEPRLLTPGEECEPEGEHRGFHVGRKLYSAQIGKKGFLCLKRTSGGEQTTVSWSEKPVTTVATEEYFLEDGRLLLWRRYNGLKWSKRDPKRKEKQSGTYELLQGAKVPEIQVFGNRYYLWYDQVPDCALSRDQ